MLNTCRTVGFYVLHYCLWSGFTVALIFVHVDDERRRRKLNHIFCQSRKTNLIHPLWASFHSQVNALLINTRTNQISVCNYNPVLPLSEALSLLVLQHIYSIVWLGLTALINLVSCSSRQLFSVKTALINSQVTTCHKLELTEREIKGTPLHMNANVAHLPVL